MKDDGHERKLKFADHALVLLLKGIKKKWKQPISYYFSQGGFNAVQLKQILKTTIEALQQIGFTIIGTVCDQYSSNINAIKQLVEDSERERNMYSDLQLFRIGGQEIVGIFDPPHLLKGIRNNLLKYNLKFVTNGTAKLCSWDDIVQLYELDVGDFNTRMCYKLTDSHIYEDKMKKMKVKHAAQSFYCIRWTIRYGKDNLLSNTAEGTADFLSLMDQLFDSVNGSTYEADHGKDLRCAVKKNSPHLDFWKESIKVLESAKFIKQNNSEFLVVGFAYLTPRHINQDSPLENFFGMIRSHGVRNVNPTCISFMASFKTSLINNFTSLHSPGANCESDENSALNSLELFLQQGTEESERNIAEPDLDDDLLEHCNTFKFSEESNDFIINTHSYIAGYVAKTLLKNIGNCQMCRNQLVSTTSSKSNDYELYWDIVIHTDFLSTQKETDHYLIDISISNDSNIQCENCYKNKYMDMTIK
ncbi:hypothetical protein NQ315_012975 [Exocentrus adspersus]|uniref:Transposable element P transposase n=1 Tax=Exocentrus adspersus TaxID=1586481 RepID=A0AAV8VRQ6_9CUCU|nr:hypothetical protein NQ315_012975 [Exocentrus adspersus]